MEGGDFPTSNQEATMELVEKLKPAQASGSQAANSTSGLDHVIIKIMNNLFDPKRIKQICTSVQICFHRF
jgi:hypothetical protein